MPILGMTVDEDDEVERLYARLKQSVHLREGFRLYHKLRAEESFERAQMAVASPDRAGDSPVSSRYLTPTKRSSATPSDPQKGQEVRKANAERFTARMLRKRAQLPRPQPDSP